MSFPKYPKYKDSGVEWLGEVPEHWDFSPLKHLAEFINGDAFKPGVIGNKVGTRPAMVCL